MPRQNANCIFSRDRWSGSLTPPWLMPVNKSPHIRHMKPRRGTVSGKPLEEPVAWYGPIVMNTQEQLRHAFEELREGTFLDSSAFGRAQHSRSRDRRAYGDVT